MGNKKKTLNHEKLHLNPDRCDSIRYNSIFSQSSTTKTGLTYSYQTNAGLKLE